MKNISDFGILGAGNDTAIFQSALDYAKENNVALQAPAGTFQMSAPLNYVTNSVDPFTPGLILVGEGADKTTLVNNHGGNDIIIGTDTAYKFQRHGLLEGISFAGGGCGPKLSSAYNYRLHGMQITGKATHGLHIPTIGGDSDACNMLTLDNVRIDSCGSWGIFGEVATGKNELSFLTLRSVFINSCGNLSTTVGGGIYWRGQMLRLDQVAFVLNNNRGLYIEGGAGLGSDIKGDNVCFENNIGMHIQCYGGQDIVFDNLQMYSNDNYKTTQGFYVNAASSVGRNILVRSGKVRATSGNNPNIAFCGVGANLSNAKAQNITWDLYGSAGQTQMIGFTS